MSGDNEISNQDTPEKRLTCAYEMGMKWWGVHLKALMMLESAPVAIFFALDHWPADGSLAE